jgi:hypothetical protein
MRKPLITAAILASCSVATSAFAVDIGDNTTVGGQTFFDFSNISNQQQAANGTYSDSTSATSGNGTSFDVKRFYLIVDHTFDDVWSADLTTDAQYVYNTTVASGAVTCASTTTGATVKPTGSASNTCPAGSYVSSVSTTSINTAGGSTEVFLKYLYLTAKISDAFTVHVGSYATPWISYVDGITGQRYIDKSINDRIGFSTADWGANASGAIAGNLLSYSLSVVNGGGYKNPSRSKKVDFEGRISSKPVDWLDVGVGVYSGHLGQVNASNDDFPQNTVTRLNALVAVHFGGFKLGGEFVNAKNYQTVNNLESSTFGTSDVVASSATGTLPSDKLQGFSVFTGYAFNAFVNVFARYDDLKLSQDVAPNLKDQYFNVGVDYKPLKSIDLALVYKNEKVDNGTFSPGTADANAKYTIGGVAANGTTLLEPTDGKFSEVGLYVQYRF